MLITFIIIGGALLLFVFLIFWAKHQMNHLKDGKDSEKIKDPYRPELFNQN